MREFICAANWKMNKSPLQARSFIKEFITPYESMQVETKVILFAPAVNLTTMAGGLKGTHVFFGGQNCHYEEEGAFTGENSPKVIQELGASHMLVGHSERRALFGETDEVIAKKLQAIQSHLMTPILCIGESLEERETGETPRVLEKQMSIGLSHCNKDLPLIVAYEPVWAIGTGKVATVAQVKEAHELIRQFMSKTISPDFSNKTSILYGGSVKPENAGELSQIDDVDGFLIGGASLKSSSLLNIIEASQREE